MEQQWLLVSTADGEFVLLLSMAYISFGQSGWSNLSDLQDFNLDLSVIFFSSNDLSVI